MKSIYKLVLLPVLLLFTMSILYAGGEERIGTSGSAQLLIFLLERVVYLWEEPILHPRTV